VELLVDGGLRDSHDVAVALELGARAVMLGRPILHALGSSSSSSLEERDEEKEKDALYRYIQTLGSSLQRTLALTGRPTLPQEARVVGDRERLFFS